MVDHPTPTIAVANYSLALLMLVFVSNQWSRYALNYLYAVPYDDDDDADKYSIAYACDLTTSEYGLLTGYGFSATFVVTGLFVGRLADKFNRRNIVVAGAIIWNIAIGAMGLCSKFWELLVFRLLLGFGQAFSNPASYSMLTDFFPPDMRPQANGIFASGVYLGGGLASVSESIAESIGWRETLFLIAGIGLFITILLLFTVHEPPRGRFNTEDKGKPKAVTSEEEKEPELSTWDAVKFLVTDPHTLTLLIAASVRYMGGYTIAGYLPYFYDAMFSSYSTEYSYINAYVVAFGGFVSSWAGGKLTTMWKESAHNPDASRVWPGASKADYYVPMIGCLAGIPFMCICCLSSNFYVSLCIGLFGEYLVAECWFGPYMSALQGGVPPNVRALSVATMMFIATFFGSLISFLIGEVYDSLVDNGHSEKVVRWLVLYCVVGTYAISAYLFYQASWLTTHTAKKAQDDETATLLSQTHQSNEEEDEQGEMA